MEAAPVPVMRTGENAYSIDGVEGIVEFAHVAPSLGRTGTIMYVAWTFTVLRDAPSREAAPHARIVLRILHPFPLSSGRPVPTYPALIVSCSALKSIDESHASRMLDILAAAYGLRPVTRLDPLHRIESLADETLARPVPSVDDQTREGASP